MGRNFICDEYENETQRLEIHYDEYPESPREYDNVGTMVCFHPRYKLGDPHHYSNAEHFIRDLAWDVGLSTEREYEDEDGEIYVDEKETEEIFDQLEEFVVILPLHLYDHGSVTMNIGGFACPWDSGQVGWIYCTYERALKEYGDINASMSKEEQRKVIEKHLEGEVEVFDDYITGNVYGFKYFEREAGEELWEEVDSCWGYIGDVDELTKDIKAEVGFRE